MIKRIVRVLAYILVMPLVFLYALLGIPIVGVFVLINYIITGEDKQDLILDLGDFILFLPDKLTKNL